MKDYIQLCYRFSFLAAVMLVIFIQILLTLALYNDYAYMPMEIEANYYKVTAVASFIYILIGVTCYIAFKQFYKPRLLKPTSNFVEMAAIDP